MKPISSRLLFYILAVLVAALFLPSAVMAHKPLFADRDITSYETALEIPNPTISYAAYGELQSQQQVDLYKVTLDVETPFYARLNTPKRPGLETFAPTFVLFGPGLPTSNEPPNYPLSLPKDLGRAIFLPQGERDEFFEPFTQTTLLQRQYVSRKLAPGTYYLAVYSPENQTGKYVLATGTEDQFGFRDWLSFPATWLKVRLWYNKGQTWLILLGLLAVLVGLLYYLRHKKRP